MRFRTLDLVRYGSFADRTIDFGDGSVDLHLVVGPNEAGKSTMLAAIGDFLFGIPGQSNQNWRFTYDQLRLRALLEHDGETLDLVRRKGTRNTLLNVDDSPADTDILSRWLFGLDRQGFERMYGLDHGKLRSGGSMILEGRDEAARIVLEAGTGLSGIGDALKIYDRTATDLFKSGGQNPLINALMRQREAARTDLRDAMLGENEWKAVREKANVAHRDREALLAEAKTLEARAAMLARVQRVRSPLARLADVEQILIPLEAIPKMPEDARAELDRAQSTLRTIDIKSEPLVSRMNTALKAVQQTVVNDLLLAHDSDICALDERRPVVEQAARDLGHRKSELAQIDRAIAAARTAAKLDGDTLPSPGWMKRAANWLDETRELSSDQQRHHTTRVSLDKQIAKIGKDDGSGKSYDSEPLRLALGRYTLDADAREADLRETKARAERRVAAALTSLAPWSGSAPALHKLALPNESVVSDEARELDHARTERDHAVAEQEAAALRKNTAQADIDRLVAPGHLPSVENVRSARNARDLVVVDAQRRLTGDRSPDDAAVGVHLSTVINEADRLVDHRESEAKRVAEHALAIFELDDATRQHDDAETRETKWTAELKRLETNWANRLQPLGFAELVPASGFATWRSAHGQALAALEDCTIATDGLARFEKELAAAVVGIVTAATAVGATVTADLPTSQIVMSSRKWLREIEDAEKAHEASRLQREAIAEGEARHGIEEETLKRRHQGLGDEESGLLREVAFFEPGATAIADAVEALKEVAALVAEQAGFKRQIDGIERDAQCFTADVRKLAELLGENVSQSAVDAVRDWTSQLGIARDAQQQRVRFQREADDAQGVLDTLASERTLAERILERLREVAAVSTDEALVGVIDAAERRQAALAKKTELIEELSTGGEGLAIAAIRAEVEAVTFDEVVGELAEIARRREEIAAEREVIAQSLTEAQRTIADAGVNDAAADAQQRIADISAQLAHAADAHVAAASSAALLRWLIDKHRSLSQAPLMARAASSFATVTRGAFVNLGIDYGDDDRPRLVGIRTDGLRVDAAGMSEGTRDQLYLALRLAAIELRVGNTVPLICDDLLVTADDARAAAMFSVLATTAATTQVIVFTHHDHLIDVARNAVGPDAFRLHRIGPTPVLAKVA
jgi:uncharacterized protein YhaN